MHGAVEVCYEGDLRGGISMGLRGITDRAGRERSRDNLRSLEHGPRQAAAMQKQTLVKGRRQIAAVENGGGIESGEHPSSGAKPVKTVIRTWACQIGHATHGCRDFGRGWQKRGRHVRNVLQDRNI